MQLHIGSDTPDGNAWDAVSIRGQSCGNYRKRAAPRGAKPDLDE